MARARAHRGSAALAGALAVICPIACAPQSRTPHCVEPPPPTAEDFAACDGIAYRAGTGPTVPFSVRFRDAMGAIVELRDVCVLVDGYTVVAASAQHGKHEWRGNVFRGKHVVSVQVTYLPKGASDPAAATPITVRAATELAMIETGVLEIVAEPIHGEPALRWVKPKGATCG